MALEMTLPPLSKQDRGVLQRIYDTFRARGEWPAFGVLDRAYDRAGADLAKVLPAIPRTYLRFDRFRVLDPPPDLELQLTLVGIAQCEVLTQT